MKFTRQLLLLTSQASEDASLERRQHYRADARVEKQGETISTYNRSCVSQSQHKTFSVNKQWLIHFIKDILSDKCQN